MPYPARAIIREKVKSVVLYLDRVIVLGGGLDHVYGVIPVVDADLHELPAFMFEDVLVQK